jgi:hypothetical protein
MLTNACRAIPEFHRIKRRVIAFLSDWTYLRIQGSTDSEYIFALILHYLAESRGTVCTDSYKGGTEIEESQVAELCMTKLIGAVETTFAFILQLLNEAMAEAEVNENRNSAIDPLLASLNICISDGVNTIASRFRSSHKGHKGGQPPSLYYSYGENYCKSGGCFGSSFDPECSSGTEKSVSQHPIQGLIITSSPLNRSNEVHRFRPLSWTLLS